MSVFTCADDSGSLERGADQRLQLVAGVEALGLARRVAAGIVPDPVLVSVGVEDHRSSAELALQSACRALACCWPTSGDLEVRLA